MTKWSLDKVSLPYSSLISAAGHGHASVVKLLLEKGRLIAGAAMDAPLREATKGGHIVVVVMLLEAMERDGRKVIFYGFLMPKFAYTSQEFRSAFRRSIGKGHVEASHFLLTKINPVSKMFLKSHRLSYFASIGRLDLVHFVIDNNLTTKKEMVHAVNRASIAGRVEVVKTILSKGKLCPSLDNNALLLAASKHGHCELVHLFLEHPSTRAVGNFEAAFVNAAGCGQMAVMQIFLEKQLINPNVCGEEAILKAIHFGCGFDVIHTILNSITANRSKIIKAALEVSCFIPNLDIARQLLQLDEAVDLDSPLIESAKSGQTSMVALILNKEASVKLETEVLWKAYTEASFNNNPLTARIIWDFVKARDAEADEITMCVGMETDVHMGMEGKENGERSGRKKARLRSLDWKKAFAWAKMDRVKAFFSRRSP
ncbi:hypothetical protein BC829DRAFT_401611 [Chytridium lagenaria]|nr:hypothetical protein BC829DRAFT_401611 [Chytridium lagenaria]